MTSVSLSADQIDHLFSFVRKKYVRWIDVQYEIVDHLATGIEHNMTENADLTFLEALNREYAKFPITGFSKLVSSKEKALTKYWSKRFFAYMISYLKLPKIIIAVFLLVILKIILQVFLVKGLYFLFFLMTIFALISHYIRKDNGFSATSPEIGKYLVTTTFASFNSGILIMIFVAPLNIIFSNFKIQSDFSGGQLWLLSILLTFVLLWGHANTFVFPKMLKDELNKKYGHLNVKLA